MVYSIMTWLRTSVIVVMGWRPAAAAWHRLAEFVSMISLLAPVVAEFVPIEEGKFANGDQRYSRRPILLFDIVPGLKKTATRRKSTYPLSSFPCPIEREPALHSIAPLSLFRQNFLRVVHNRSCGDRTHDYTKSVKSATNDIIGNAFNGEMHASE